MTDLNKQMYKRLCEDFREKGIYIENGIMKNVFGTPRFSIANSIIYLTTVSGKERYSATYNTLEFKIDDFQKVINTVMALYKIAQTYGDYRYISVNNQTAKKIVNQYFKSRKISIKPMVKCEGPFCYVGALGPYFRLQYDSKTKQYVVSGGSADGNDWSTATDGNPIPVEEYLDKHLATNKEV